MLRSGAPEDATAVSIGVVYADMFCIWSARIACATQWRNKTHLVVHVGQHVGLGGRGRLDSRALRGIHIGRGGRRAGAILAQAVSGNVAGPQRQGTYKLLEVGRRVDDRGGGLVRVCAGAHRDGCVELEGLLPLLRVAVLAGGAHNVVRGGRLDVGGEVVGELVDLRVVLDLGVVGVVGAIAVDGRGVDGRGIGTRGRLQVVGRV